MTISVPPAFPLLLHPLFLSHRACSSVFAYPIPLPVTLVSLCPLYLRKSFSSVKVYRDPHSPQQVL